MKICIKCKEKKGLSEFKKRKDAKDGYRGECKTCSNKLVYYYKKSNIEKVKEQNRLYRIKNKEVFKENYIKNKDEVSKKSKLYYLKNSEYIRNKSKKYTIDNKDKINVYRNNYNKKRKLIDPLFKLRCNIRSLIGCSIRIKGYSKKSKTYQILGCTFEDFKVHLEKQFTKGMNWENQGQWHMDHIYPVSLAKDEEELIKLNHYTNFQPLWAIDNLKKGNKIIN